MRILRINCFNTELLWIFIACADFQIRFLFKCSSLIASKYFLKDGVRSFEARSEWVFLNVLSEDHNSHPSFPGVSQGLSRPILENTKPTNLQWDAAKQENKILALKIDSTCNWEKKTLSFNKILGLNESYQIFNRWTHRQCKLPLEAKSF